MSLPACVARGCAETPHCSCAPQAAGGAFNVLFKGGAGSAVDGVIPSLLAGLDGPDPGRALEGLRVILGVRPSTFNTMVPRLLKPPLTGSHVAALGALAEVAGASLPQHLSQLVPPLLTLASRVPRNEAAADALRSIVLSVEEDGAYLLVSELTKVRPVCVPADCCTSVAIGWAAWQRPRPMQGAAAHAAMQDRVGFA